MPWNAEQIVVLVVVALGVAGLGYLAATLRLAKKVVNLEGQLDRAQTEVQAKSAQVERLQADHRELQDSHHRVELELSQLREQLTGARDRQRELENRLEQSGREAKHERERLQQELSQTRERQHEAEKRKETAQTEAGALAERLAELKAQFGEQAQALRAQQDRYNSLSTEHAELKTSLDAREKHYKEQLAQLAEARQSLTQEFENLANKIFEEKGKTFTDTSKASIDVLLKPFREQIEGFQKRVNEVHDASIRGQSDLNAEIRKVLDVGLKMSAEANNLTSALKGDSQQRGAWGEAQLKRTLEMSGLVEDDHYEVQSAFRDADGKHKQTDYLIKLPDSKHIIIDSKVSLVAYDRAVGAETPEEYQVAMAEHVKAVKRHIDDLASKDYTNLVGVRSPSFVLMFMPIEPAYIEALKHNKELFEYGYKKNIVLVSHTTLIPILRTVSNLWMIERSNAEAREISERAGAIYNQVCVVAEHLNRLGGTLKTVGNHYNKTVTALAGQQGLYGKVERFSQLSAKVSKSLPELEPAHSDFETERLSLIVEPIDEPGADGDEVAPQSEEAGQQE